MTELARSSAMPDTYKVYAYLFLWHRRYGHWTACTCCKAGRLHRVRLGQTGIKLFGVLAEARYRRYLTSVKATTTSKPSTQNSPIDWYVYSSAVALEQPDAPEFAFCHEHEIRMSKRDELLNEILAQKKLKLFAVAGTHGKTTTTAMAIWLAKQLGMPIGYILPRQEQLRRDGRTRSGSGVLSLRV